MTFEEKKARLRELFGIIEKFEAEIAEIIGPDAKKAQPVKPEKQGKAGRGHACCGSKGTRHRNGCERVGKLPPDGPVKAQSWKCVYCDYTFNARERADCPECKSNLTVLTKDL